MNKIKTIVAGALVSLTALGSSGAWADCTQPSFEGTYQVYVTAAVPPGQVLWAQCRVAINAAGTIANTTCTTSQAPTTNLPLTGASVKLSNSGLCLFTGAFKIATTTYTVRQITLSDDHLYAKGIGSEPVPFTVDLVRIN